MDINQLIEIIEKKILSHDCISKVKIEDKSFLHKNHKNNVQGKFHILLSIESKDGFISLTHVSHTALILLVLKPLFSFFLPG